MHEEGSRHRHDHPALPSRGAARRLDEDKYRTLFNSIDQGFCMIEALFDGQGRCVDYVFLEVNDAFERQTGLKDATGRRVRELALTLEQHWFDIYGRIALTGEPQRFERPADSIGAYYDVYAFRVGEPEQRTVGILFTDISDRKRAEAALRDSQARLARELSDARLLQEVSGSLVESDGPQPLFERVVDAARALMDADAASLQLLDLSGERLLLAASRNFHPASEAFWRWVDAGSDSTCGDALRLRRRIVVSDVESSAAMAGSKDLEAYRRSGLAAVQSTPLVTRAGHPVGIISTHWRSPRPLKEDDFALFDVLARQAADLIERTQTEEALRESGERPAFLLRFSDLLRAETDPDAMAERALAMLFDQLRLDRCYIGRYRLADDRADLPYQVGNHRVPPLPEAVRLSDFPAAMEVASERTLVIDDFAETEGLSDVDRRSFGALGLRALVAASLRKAESDPVWVLVAVSADPRRWKPAEIALVEEVAERTWAAMERARVEAALRESEERLRSFGEASSDVLWVRDADTLAWNYLSPAFERVYGQSLEAALNGDTLSNWLDLILPEDRERVRAHIARVRAGERVTFDFRVRRPSDGEIRRLRNTDFPIRGPDGRVARIGGVGHDATEERQSAERQAVLVAELQHRTRNLLGVIRTLADQTVASSANLAEFRDRFLDRIRALARANGLLSRLDEGRRVTFDELLRAELDASGEVAHRKGKVTLSGPKGVPLRSSGVQTLAMAIHELATNALKYGALNQPDGRLTIRWRVAQAANGRPWLHIDWRETGVTVPVAAPAASDRGSGRRLIERALPYQLGARTTFAMRPDGVHCTIALPTSDQGGGEERRS